MIELIDVTKVYRTADVETTALDSVSLSIARGEFVAITGPSGCGKSTLLSIIGTLDRPTAGDFKLDGVSLGRAPEATLARMRRDHVGFIFQSFNLIDEMSVRDNIALPLLYRGVAKKERRALVEAAMEKVDIQHRADHRPSRLSGGQQQRAAVARAIVSNPPIVLADEPTGNLDSHYGEEVLASLERLNREGTTVVMVTHTPEYAARAKRRITLLDGSVTGDATR